MIGKLIYKYFFAPTLPIRYYLTHFGVGGWLRLVNGERSMKIAAQKLKPIVLSDDYQLECNYLTGEKYWYQTIFCAYSLAKVMQGRVKINIYSDGTTMPPSVISLFNKVLKGIRVISPNDVENDFNLKLPADRYPSVRYLRGFHPMFRKLIDTRLNDRYIVQLDSDMLFFNFPVTLVEAYLTGDSYFMEDKADKSFYVVPEKQIEEQFGLTMKPNINAGILAFDSARIDWDFVECVCKYFLENLPVIYGPLLEQTINAIIVSRLDAKPLNQYYNILYDNKNNAVSADDVVRHYIFKAREFYQSSEWQKVL
jgi:hypothetical protein